MLNTLFRLFAHHNFSAVNTCVLIDSALGLVGEYIDAKMVAKRTESLLFTFNFVLYLWGIQILIVLSYVLFRFQVLECKRN